MLSKIWNYIQNNHWAMMAICCALPVLAIFALKALGINDWWVYPAALLFCLIGHGLMMMLGGSKKCH